MSGFVGGAFAGEIVNLPFAAGVPPVIRDVTRVLDTALLLEADALIFLEASLPSLWGIFTLGGQPIAIADSVLAVDLRKESRIASAPIEQGSFRTYNKVQNPFESRVRLACSGNGVMTRDQFLAAIDAAYQVLDQFVVVTPDALYPNANIIHYDYRRDQSSANMIVIDVWLQEVRESVGTQFVSTKQATGQGQVNGGTVQPAAPPSALATDTGVGLA